MFHVLTESRKCCVEIDCFERWKNVYTFTVNGKKRDKMIL